MSSQIPEGRTSRVERWKLASGDDLERALRAAEHLLAQAEERRRHEENRSFALTSVVIGVVLSLAASLVAVVKVFSFESVGGTVLATVFSILLSSVILTMSLRALLRQRHNNEGGHTLRLATEIAALVGEAMVDVADREKWSYLRLEATKMRLSAFPLLDRPHRMSEG